MPQDAGSPADKPQTPTSTGRHSRTIPGSRPYEGVKGRGEGADPEPRISPLTMAFSQNGMFSSEECHGARHEVHADRSSRGRGAAWNVPTESPRTVAYLLRIMLLCTEYSHRKTGHFLPPQKDRSDTGIPSIGSLFPFLFLFSTLLAPHYLSVVIISGPTKVL